MLLHCPVHADAGVVDREHHVRARGRSRVLADPGGVEVDVPRFDRQRAAARHCVARVQREVQHHLLDLTGIRADAIERLRQLPFEADVFADQPPEQRVHPRHDRIQIEDLGMQQLLPAEREQLPGQRRGALSGAADLLNIGTDRMVR